MSKSGTIQRILNMRPNVKWFNDEKLNIYFNNIKSARRQLTGNTDPEQSRIHGRRIADNGKILHRIISRDFIEVNRFCSF